MKTKLIDFESAKKWLRLKKSIKGVVGRFHIIHTWTKWEFVQIQKSYDSLECRANNFPSSQYELLKRKCTKCELVEYNKVQVT